MTDPVVQSGLPPLPPGAVLIPDDRAVSTWPGARAPVPQTRAPMGAPQPSAPSVSSPELPPLPEGAVLIQDEPSPAAEIAKTKPMEWGWDMIPEALVNLPGSIGREVVGAVKGMYDAATDPVATAKTVGKLGMTLPGVDVTDLARTIMPLLPDKQKKVVGDWIVDMHQPIDALKKDFHDAYGSDENFRRTLTENPGRLLLDLSSVLTGGETAAGKVGQVAKRAAEITDPATAAGKIAKGAANLPAGYAGMASGTGGDVYRKAFSTGVEGGRPSLDFRQAMRQGMEPGEVVARAQEGVDAIKKEAMRVYDVRKNDPRHGWSNDATTLDFTPIRKRWTDVIDSMVSKKGMRTVADDEWNQIQKIGDIINEWEQNPAARTADDFDSLRRRIDAVYPDNPQQRQVRRAAGVMAKAVNTEIKRQVPGYARAMSDYAKAREALDVLQGAFSVGDNTKVQVALTKLQSAGRNNVNTQFGHRLNQINKVRDETGVDIFAPIAGMNVNSWTPRGIQRALVGTGAATAGAATGLINPALAATLATASPRLMGETFHGLGRAAGAVARPTSRAYGALPPRGREVFERLASRPGRLGMYQGANAIDPGTGAGTGETYADGGAVEAPDPLAGSATIGLNSLVANLRNRPRLPPPRTPEVPLITAEPAPAPVIDNEWMRLIDQAKKTFSDTGKSEEEKRLERLRETLASMQAAPAAALADAVAKATNTTDGGAPPDEDRYLAQTAKDEGANDTQIENPGSRARGLFQFLPSTWADMVKRHPDLGLTVENLYEKDPVKAREYQTKAMKRFTADNVAHFEKTMGRKPTGGEMYMMHMLGPTGGVRLAQGAAQALPEIVDKGALAGNPGLAKFKTGVDALAYYNRRFG
jgi:hypothetical protein